MSDRATMQDTGHQPDGSAISSVAGATRMAEADGGHTRFDHIRQQQTARIISYVDDIVIAVEGETEPLVLPRVRLDQGHVVGLRTSSRMPWPRPRLQHGLALGELSPLLLGG